MLKRIVSFALVLVMMSIVLMPTAQAATSVSGSGKYRFFATTTSSWNYRLSPTKLTIKIAKDDYKIFDKSLIDTGLSGFEGITKDDISYVIVSICKKGTTDYVLQKRCYCNGDNKLVTVTLKGKATDYDILILPVLSSTPCASTLKAYFGCNSVSAVNYTLSVNKGSISKAK